MKHEYDAIISLGGFCGAASQLRARGLRTASYPFDWTFMDGPQTISWLIDAFKTDFADYFKKENLVPLIRDGVGGLAPYQYRDTVSGYCFIHHFWKPLEEGYDGVAATTFKRLKRMLACFVSGKSVLLILATPFPFDPALAHDLLVAIRARYPETAIDMHVMQFNTVFDDPLVESMRWPDALPFTGARYARKHGAYDLSRTSAEWAFLDGLSFVDAKPPKAGFWTKISLKLWKRFPKRLRNAGFGVLGVRFKHAR